MSWLDIKMESKLCECGKEVKEKRNFTEEHRKNLGNSMRKALKGKKWTEERKRNHKITMNKSEVKEKISHTLKGHITTKETRKKISESQKITMNKQEHREKRSLALKGHIITETTKNKISEALKGEKSYMWKGGKSFEPYNIDFNKKLKKAIKERDGCCMLCNMGFEDLKLLKRIIVIHHINYIKIDNFRQNLITLCNNCHSLTNHNRIHWTIFLQTILKEKYNYEYTQDQKIILDFT